jgi:elongation factor P hydroxylase
MTNSEQYRLQMIIQLFDNLFLDGENTQLIGGADEPLYIPSFIV